WALPDLIVIDGGKGQLNRVVAAVQDLGIPVGVEGIDLVSLAKERKDFAPRTPTGLSRLRSRAATEPAETVAGEATPGKIYEDWAVSDDASPDADTPTEVRPERVFVPGVKDPIVLQPGSSERFLMERVRDEAHRFAIGHHRKRRAKRSLRSALDEIEGVGPALKRALVRHFGSVAAIRRADVEALAEVKGIGPALAERIHASLR